MSQYLMLYPGLTKSQHNVQILRDGHLVARSSDYIIYSVEAEAISRVVETYAICTTPLILMRTL